MFRGILMLYCMIYHLCSIVVYYLLSSISDTTHSIGQKSIKMRWYVTNIREYTSQYFYGRNKKPCNQNKLYGTMDDKIISIPSNSNLFFLRDGQFLRHHWQSKFQIPSFLERESNTKGFFWSMKAIYFSAPLLSHFLSFFYEYHIIYFSTVYTQGIKFYLGVNEYRRKKNSLPLSNFRAPVRPTGYLIVFE